MESSDAFCQQVIVALVFQPSRLDVEERDMCRNLIEKGFPEPYGMGFGHDLLEGGNKW